MALHDIPLTGGGVARDAVLLFGADSLNSPLWSLQWEVLFSLLLPAYVWFAARFRRFWVGVALVSIVVTFGGFVVQIPAVEYLPMFMIGVVLATQLPTILERTPALLRGRRGWVVLIAALLAITAHWWILPFFPAHAFALGLPFTMIAAAALVILAMAWPPAKAGLSIPFAQWAGRISFSLYLTHEPIVVTVGQLLPVQLARLTPIIAIPIALAVAAAFFRFVEAPTHRLSQRIRHTIRDRTALGTGSLNTP